MNKIFCDVCEKEMNSGENSQAFEHKAGDKIVKIRLEATTTVTEENDGDTTRSLHVCKQCVNNAVSSAPACEPMMQFIVDTHQFMMRIDQLEWTDPVDRGAGLGLTRWICDITNKARGMFMCYSDKTQQIEKRQLGQIKYELDSPEDEMLGAIRRAFRKNLSHFGDMETMHKAGAIDEAIFEAAIRMNWHEPHPTLDEVNILAPKEPRID